MDHYNIDDATTNSVTNTVLGILNGLKDGESKTLTSEEIKKVFKK